MIRFYFHQKDYENTSVYVRQAKQGYMPENALQSIWIFLANKLAIQREKNTVFIGSRLFATFSCVV